MFVTIPRFLSEFIDVLDNNVKGKVFQLIELMRLRDYPSALLHSKKIEDGLFELRVKSTQNIRIFFTVYQGSIFLLHAINKKRWKIPKKDLEIAKRRKEMLQK